MVISSIDYEQTKSKKSTVVQVSWNATSQATEWRDLLEAARNGDDVALGQICQQYYDHLLLMANQGLGDDLGAKLGASDVVQQSMLEVHNDLERFEGKSEQEFRRWITRLVERNLIDVARQFRQTQRRDISREEPIDAEQALFAQTMIARGGTASQIIRKQEADQELSDVVAKLPLRQRQVVEFRHRQGLSYTQIAERLEISEAAARKLWSRAIKQLQQGLARRSRLVNKNQRAEKYEQRPIQPK